MKSEWIQGAGVVSTTVECVSAYRLFLSMVYTTTLFYISLSLFNNLRQTETKGLLLPKMTKSHLKGGLIGKGEIETRNPVLVEVHLTGMSVDTFTPVSVPKGDARGGVV